MIINSTEPINPFDVKATSGNRNILLSFIYHGGNTLAYNFKMELMVHRSQIGSQRSQKFYEKILYIPEQTVRINGLEGNRMYKISCVYRKGEAEVTKTVHVFVSEDEASDQPAANRQNNPDSVRERIRNYFQEYPQRFQKVDAEQIPLKSMKKSPPTYFSNSQGLLKVVAQCHNICGKKKTEKYLLDARKCRNTDQFLVRSDRISNYKDYSQRQDLLLNGLIVFDEVYNRDQEGMKFFQNDWFQGPFYSYDQNETTLKRN